MFRFLPAAALSAVPLLALGTGPAAAHHVMDGALPQSFGEGLLSGLGHPIIGLDHLAFVVAVGILAAFQRRGAVMPLAFLGAMLVGVGLHLGLVDLPLVEPAIVLSVLLLGVLVVSGRNLSAGVTAAILAVAGIFHGYAYGESIVGAESTALVAYLIGLTAVQYGIALIAFLATRSVLAQPERATWARVAGGVVLGVGIAFLSGLVVPEPGEAEAQPVAEATQS